MNIKSSCDDICAVTYGNVCMQSDGWQKILNRLFAAVLSSRLADSFSSKYYYVLNVIFLNEEKNVK